MAVTAAALALATGCLEPNEVYLSVGDGPGAEYALVGDENGAFRRVELPRDTPLELEEGVDETLHIVRPEVTTRVISYLGLNDHNRSTISVPAPQETVPADDTQPGTLAWSAFPGAAQYEVRAKCERSGEPSWIAEPIVATDAMAEIRVPAACRYSPSMIVRVSAQAASGALMATTVNLLEFEPFEENVLTGEWGEPVVYRRELEDIPRDAVSLVVITRGTLYEAYDVVDVRGRSAMTFTMRVPGNSVDEEIILSTESGAWVRIVKPFHDVDGRGDPLPPWPPRVTEPRLDADAGVITWRTIGSGAMEWAAAELDTDGSGVPEWVVYDVSRSTELELPPLPEAERALLPDFAPDSLRVIVGRRDGAYRIESYSR